jgi:predicted signal transduction protein with EAL and GGDEF domain
MFSGGPEEPAFVRELAEQRFAALDLASGHAGLGRQVQRHDVIEGVVADPVALRVRAFGQGAAIAQLVAYREEARQDIVAGLDIEHLRVTSGSGPLSKLRVMTLMLSRRGVWS